MPPTRREFARQFRALTPKERVAFVADLLALQGWEVTREGRLIVAHTGDHRRVIHVGSPPPPPDAAVDEVIPVPSRLSVLVPGPWVSGVGVDTLGEHGVLGVATLHEQLCYAIDGGEARRLYREHFEAPFDTPTADREWPLRLSPRGLAATGLLLVAVLALAVVPGGVGVGDQAGSADRATGETGDTPVETAPPDDGTSRSASDRATPVLFENGELEDVDRLSRSHVAALSDPPVRMRATFRGPRFLTGFDTRRSGFDAEDTVRLRIAVESETRYHVVRETRFRGNNLTRMNVTVERLADGRVVYRRVERPDEVGYQRRPLASARSGPDAVESWSRLLVTRYLNTSERRIESVPRRSGVRYRIIASGDPMVLDHAAEDYRAVAIVEPKGWISALRVTYLHPRTNTRVRVTAQYERTDDPLMIPAWYDDVTDGTVDDP